MKKITKSFMCVLFFFLLSVPVWAENNFIDNENNTLSDLTTSLMWQQADDGILRNWEKACDYCDSLILADYGDWRVPNRDELETLVDSYYTPPIDPLFVDVKDAGYWYYDADEVLTSNYYTRCTRRESSEHLPGDFDALLQFPDLLTVDPRSQEDCLLDWMEANYLNLSDPSNIQSQQSNGFYFRYYPEIDTYTGISLENNHVYYSGEITQNTLIDLGDISMLYETSGCEELTVEEIDNSLSADIELSADDQGLNQWQLRKSVMITPRNGSQFRSTSQKFYWSNVGASQYYLFIGSAYGKNNILSYNAGKSTGVSVNKLPSNGKKLYITLWSLHGHKWYYNTYIYTAYKYASNIPSNKNTICIVNKSSYSIAFIDINNKSVYSVSRNGGTLSSNKQVCYNGYSNGTYEIDITLWKTGYVSWVYRTIRVSNGKTYRLTIK